MPIEAESDPIALPAVQDLEARHNALFALHMQLRADHDQLRLDHENLKTDYEAFKRRVEEEPGPVAFSPSSIRVDGFFLVDGSQGHEPSEEELAEEGT